MQDLDNTALVLAIVNGEALSCLPEDLYIPPDALKVFLETFEGPLDLLLYLIKKQRLDVLNIPIAQITRQYMAYVALIQGFRFELAAEYLVMAAVLAEIKSRMLLPSLGATEDMVEDPRAELVRRLQEYEYFQKAAKQLDALNRLERDYFLATAESLSLEAQKILPDVCLQDLIDAMQNVLTRAAHHIAHSVESEPLSVHERMSDILLHLKTKRLVQFVELFKVEEGRRGIVVTFMAILELLKQSLIHIAPSDLFAPISVMSL